MDKNTDIGNEVSETLKDKDENEEISEEIHLGDRERKPTQKYKDYQSDLNEQNFRRSISAWRRRASCLERLRSDCDDISVLKSEVDKLVSCFDEVTTNYESFSAVLKSSETDDVYQRYEEIERDHYLLMKCISEHIRDFESEVKSKSSHYRKSSKRSSYSASSKAGSTRDIKAEAAADAAVLRAKLDYIDHESEVKAEIERKTREMEKLQIKRELHMAEAKYEAMVKSEREDVHVDFEDEFGIKPENKQQVMEKYLHNVEQHNISDPPVTTHQNTTELNISAPEFIPAATPVTSQRGQPDNITQDGKAFIQSLTEQLSFQRLPPPEPGIFTGNPLQYPGWKTAFKMLIEQRNIPTNERIYYLKRYLSGEAKEAVEGFLLLSTESAYNEAKELLDQRFGDVFVIANAFRDKLEAWPRIHQRDALGLRKFSDFLRQCEAAMESMSTLNMLNDDRENHKLLKKLPEWLVPRWGKFVSEWKNANRQFPPFKKFVRFITKEANIACDPVTSIQSLKSTKIDTEITKSGRKEDRRGVSSFSTEVDAPPATQPTRRTEKIQTCMKCKKGHHIDECKIFLAESLQDRKKFAITHGLCFGCLNQNHRSKLCKNRRTCAVCDRKHPTSLHGDTRPNYKGRDESGSTVVKSEASRVTHFNDTNTNNKCSMIVPVWISHRNNPDTEYLTYALLDTQSDTTFILESTKESLAVTGTDVQLILSTMFAENKVVDSQRVDGLVVRGFDSNLRIPLPTVYTRGIMPANRSHIPTPEKVKQWPHLRKIAHKLAPLQDCDVGLLIGYNCARALTPRDVIPPKNDGPYGQRTDLGWGVVGIVDIDAVSETDLIGTSHRILTYEVHSPSSIQELRNEHSMISLKTTIKEVISPKDITRLLERDFPEHDVNSITMSIDDIQFLSKLEKGIHLTPQHHYEMPLPFKNSDQRLPNNRAIANHRLRHLAKRLKNDHQYCEDYIAFMNDIIQKGHAEHVPHDEISKQDGTVWYIPHHGVYHPKKPGKIRVVFDCSSKFKGVSLNDCLLSGPDLTNTLVGVLLRFRQERVAVMCDVEQMFHQFNVNAEHRNFLRFLWWSDSNLDVEPMEYRMTVHLFGAASSPGCANFGLKQAAQDGETEFGYVAANFIRHNFYVDDGLRSVPSPSEAINLINNSKNICAKAGLRLHKFVSNSKEVIASIPEEDQAKCIKDVDLLTDNLPIERALGIQWCIENDSFEFRITLKDRPLTRRGVLSTVSSVYDPLGFISPLVLTGKQILQETCREQTDWDSSLPDHLRLRWEKWRNDLVLLEQLHFARCFIPDNFSNIKTTQLHHFSDASSTGYGQCSYLRMVDRKDNVQCSFVIGKSRVMPMRSMTIPRLELTAALVSARMSTFLRSELELNDLEEFFWIDSKVALGYICNDSRRFHIFVSNRIQQIREHTKLNQWNYISSKENPADCASRGLTATELLQSDWCKGPDFLWRTEITKTKVETEEFSLAADDVELKKAKCFASGTKPPVDLLQRLEYFSDWHRVRRAVANCIKLTVKLQTGTVKRHTIEKSIHQLSSFHHSPTVEQLQEAEREIVRQVQREAFTKELEVLRSQNSSNTRKKFIDRSSRLYRLDPFIDKDGIIRVGGRMRRTSYSLERKHPAILPRNHHMTTLVIRHFHEKSNHQGRGITTNEIRSSGYWILGCSAAVSSYVFKCVKCRKIRYQVQKQKMADLPSDRVEPAAPFSYCATDLFGPFYVKEGRKELKRYGVLFSCMGSRAVHIEVANSLSTDSFINALRRFIAIRGPIRQLRCDQGTNFVGARNELKQALNDMDQHHIKDFLLKRNCDFFEFKMNPPHASHMGGSWERLIRSIRSALSSVLEHSGSQLDDEGLHTFMQEAAAIVNSRPLTTESLNDPTSLQPISPNQLLTLKSEIILPPPGEFERVDIYSRRRWRRVQYLVNQFWSRWKNEYLQTLQQRQKWTRPQRNLQVGDIVIIKDENLPRCRWQLARVHEVYPSQDNFVRKVKLAIAEGSLDSRGRRACATSFLERPIQKLVLLLEAD